MLPYTPVVRAGPWLIVSGQVGAREGSIVPGGIRPQTEQALANLAALLADNGATLANVAKTTVFMTDIANFGDINEVYASAFGDHLPARSAVAVAALPLGASVEVEAWAYCPGPEPH
jgi:2-iminobutanoate/2-iminopropanoate deaminase